jgi:hypothetical protein
MNADTHPYSMQNRPDLLSSALDGQRVPWKTRIVWRRSGMAYGMG